MTKREKNCSSHSLVDDKSYCDMWLSVSEECCRAVHFGVVRSFVGEVIGKRDGR